MPVLLLDRLPLPNLEAYTAISVLLLSGSVYYAVQVTNDSRLQALAETSKAITGFSEESGSAAGEDEYDFTAPGFFIGQVLMFMIQEPMCIWTLINMAYCCLILLGRFIQKLVFGELRVSEQQHIKDKFWNFVFYKFIFVFGVINVQNMDEVVLWCSWFSVLGFLHLLAQLCKDRFEYLSFSPTTPKWSHIRLLSLLFGILAFSGLLLLICILVGWYAGLNTFSFMAAECVLLTVRTLYVIARYGIHLWDASHERLWENRGTYVYFTELVFELSALAIDLVHHIHMLLWSNIFLSMASLVICMQLRYLFYEIQHRIKKHKNYLQVVRHMEKNYPMATPEELQANPDNCAICWDKMDSARKLPCIHFFHNTCLRSWLEQDTSCPTCRKSLSDQSASGSEAAAQRENTRLGNNQAENQPANHTTNHFFHFDGSRYVSWLPSFSVEVTHTQLLRSDQTQPAQTSQLDTMARQVQQMFPHMPLSLIIEDLHATHSVEMTIENILNEKLVPPPPMFQRDTTPMLEAPDLEISSPSRPGGSPSITGEKRVRVEEKRNFVSSSLEDALSATQEGYDSDGCCEPHHLGGRFSKSSKEREHMLQSRKDELLAQARRKYITRHTISHSPGETLDPGGNVGNSGAEKPHFSPVASSSTPQAMASLSDTRHTNLPPDGMRSWSFQRRYQQSWDNR